MVPYTALLAAENATKDESAKVAEKAEEEHVLRCRLQRVEEDLRRVHSEAADSRKLLAAAEAAKGEALMRALAGEAAAARGREEEHVLQDRFRRAVEELKRQMASIRVRIFCANHSSYKLESNECARREALDSNN